MWCSCWLLKKPHICLYFSTFLPSALLSCVRYEGGAGEADGRLLQAGSHRRWAVRRQRRASGCKGYTSSTWAWAPERPVTSPPNKTLFTIYTHTLMGGLHLTDQTQPTIKKATVLEYLFLSCSVRFFQTLLLIFPVTVFCFKTCMFVSYCYLNAMYCTYCL